MKASAFTAFRRSAWPAGARKALLPALLAVLSTQASAQPSAYPHLLFEASRPDVVSVVLPATDASATPARQEAAADETPQPEALPNDAPLADAPPEAALPSAVASPELAEAPPDPASEAAPPSTASDSPVLAAAAMAEYQATISRLEQSVRRLELERGPYSPELGEQLRSLGDLYTLVGNHAEAILAYEKAMHLVRVNEGLFTLSQASLVEGLIHSYLAVQDFREADSRQEYLYYLNQKNYGPEDPELLNAKIAWADWNVQAYFQRVDGYRNPVTVHNHPNPANLQYIPVIGPNNTVTYLPRTPGFGGGMSLGGSLMSNHMAGTATYSLDPRLRVARDLYEEIGETLETDEEASSPRLRNLSEQRLANISYIVKQEMDTLQSRLGVGGFYNTRAFRPEQVPEVARGFVKGRDALEARLEALRGDTGTAPEALATTLLELADWHLAYQRSKPAADLYKEAWETLRDAGNTAAEIETFFFPQPAVEIPAHAMHRYSRALLGIPEDEAVPYKGYVDVQMDLGRHGEARRLKVLASSPGTPGEVQNALIDHLRNATLRPRLDQGEPVDSRDIVVRYHYSY